MTIKMKWVKELPGRPLSLRRPKSYAPRGGSADLHEHAAQLVRYPMRWAQWPREIKSSRYAQKLVNAVQEGTIAAYTPDLGFEAAYREGTIYVRHNPDMFSPTRVAFNQGVEHGRMKALEDVKKLHTAYHQELTDLKGWPY